MKIKNLNYYGNSKENFKKCQELIIDTNWKHARILNIWFALLCLVLFFVSRSEMFGYMTGNQIVYFVYFLCALLCSVRLLLCKKASKLETRILVLFNVLCLTSFGIYESVFKPYMAATMFLVLLVVVSISYIDTFLIGFLVLFISSAVFTKTSFVFKPFSIVYVDLYNVVVFFLLALVLHYTFQRTRIAHFITYYENVEIQHDLHVRSSFDALTSLLNRGRFFAMAEEILQSSHEEYIVVCLFDLDGFKQINDKLGHQMGDKAIQVTGESLLDGFGIDFGEKWTFPERAVKDKLSFAGRLGGDEFIVMLRGCSSRKEVTAEIQKVLDALSQVHMDKLDGIHSSVGVTELSAEDKDMDAAYNRADEALYRSKMAGKHQITFF